ncbi:maleylacetoacetate isomerase [Bdellovibrio bacteriovorus]|uniref:Maleylacetoacetate isomerase n=1 Tax=Bdellovibrio bacteriovorus TaxID=959 RepID=A0A150WRY6_BDEBC|nr:maleylacetoacetate isomerase [Bdellovibrio bacteriovorus]KYG66965.1 maleylacetoacetate isomerase [Bdellovibrio bacteriovorus]
MAGLVLYNYFRSSTSYRVRLALNLKGLDYDYKAVNLLKNEQRDPAYLKLNPLGGLPTLVHNGQAIPESFAIVEYLDEVFPQNPLLPKDPYKRARIRQFCEVINSFMHPMGNLKTLKYMETKHQYSQEMKEGWMAHWLPQGLETLENIASEFSGKYTFGDEITMADVFLIPQMLTSNRFKVDTSKYKTLTKIYENCTKHPAFIKADPFRQIDTPEDLRTK